jgi:putative transposase
MKYNPNLYHHRSIRLKDYEYSQAGIYYISIYTHNHQYYLGKLSKRELN